MSRRIEHTDTLALLRDLPDAWAQTCIARPPQDGSPSRTLAILTETRRVLREDATLWLLVSSADRQLLAGVQAQGWTQQITPSWATQHTAYGCGSATRLFLFTKQTRYFYDAHTIGVQRRPLTSYCQLGCGRPGHVQQCPLERERERGLGVLKRCVLAGSSPRACGECGAPYRRNLLSERAPGVRRPTCPHNNPGGHCLVLDPFYEPVLPTAEATALCTGRSFLGVTDTAHAGASQ